MVDLEMVRIRYDHERWVMRHRRSADERRTSRRSTMMILAMTDSSAPWYIYIYSYVMIYNYKNKNHIKIHISMYIKSRINPQQHSHHFSLANKRNRIPHDNGIHTQSYRYSYSLLGHIFRWFVPRWSHTSDIYVTYSSHIEQIYVLFCCHIYVLDVTYSSHIRAQLFCVMSTW
jgi:hypothetical protein